MNNKPDEYSRIKYLTDKISKELGDEAGARYNYLSLYYIKKARYNRKMYCYIKYAVAIISGLISVVSTINSVLNGASVWDVFVVALSSTSSVLAVVLGTVHPHENWIRFRRGATKIQTETDKFFIEREKYKGIPRNWGGEFKAILNNIENEETNEWSELLRQK